MFANQTRATDTVITFLRCERRITRQYEYELCRAAILPVFGTHWQRLNCGLV